MSVLVKTELPLATPRSLPVDDLIGRIPGAVKRFADWLAGYGETSYDFQDYYASDLGRSRKS